MTATQTLSRNGWIRASVGGHWSQGPYTISTQTGGGQPSGYVVQWGFSQIGERYPTFSAAKNAAERHAMQTPKKTATAAYAERFATCQSLIAQLQRALNLHCSLQDIHQENWGFVGDLGKLEQDLRELLAFMPQVESDTVEGGVL